MVGYQISRLCWYIFKISLGKSEVDRRHEKTDGGIGAVGIPGPAKLGSAVHLAPSLFEQDLLADEEMHYTL
uniref:Uncharacterized protein n=1 Tax=Ascaris lumbricoides TaxID=6252 RepID=A0A0M3I342_ASCLU